MAKVEAMAFSPSGFSLEDKGIDTYSWQDSADQAGPMDFFEEFVQLDGPDTSGDSDSSRQLCGAADKMDMFSPQLAFELPPPPHAANSSADTSARPTSATRGCG